MPKQYRLSGCFRWLGLVFLGALPIGPVLANPVFPDENSLSNGAQLYDLYCSDCHGSDTTSAYSPGYEPPSDSAADFAKVVAREQRKRAEKAAEQARLAAEKTPWPEWAERPDPDAEAPPDPKMETLAELNALIDAAHGIKPDEDAGDNADTTAGQQSGEDLVVGGFTPLPGVTNLADPATYFYGTSEEEMFNSIANGTSAGMTGWRDELGSDTAIWDLVNYLRSFWTEEWRE